MPLGVVVVTRPTKWGNPHPLALGRAEAVHRYGEDLLDEPCHADVLLAVANG